MDHPRELHADCSRFYKLGRNGVLHKKTGANCYSPVQAKALKRLQILASKITKRIE